MVQMKLLDSGPFYYHEYEKILRRKRDEFGAYVNEKPDKSWLLPYQPLYIMTDEEWLIERIKEYREKAFDMIDIVPQVNEDSFFCCSIPQEMFFLCQPPSTRYVENELPEIPDEGYPYTSFGHKV